MEENANILSNAEQRKINYLQNRFTPYFLILLFVSATAVLRALLLDWYWWQQLLGFAGQFIVLSGVWQLIKVLNQKLETRYPFEEGPLRRMFLQIFLTFLIVAPFVATMAYFAVPYLPDFVKEEFSIFISISFMMFTVIIVLFNFSFYASYFFRNWQDSIEQRAALEVHAAELQREKYTLQYHQLRNQVNPHYLFNTLTSLDGLIHTDPELASEFVRHMAKVYRYVLQHKESEVVNLEEELDFISHYIELLHIRYGEGLSIHHNISWQAKERGIVMVTLQMLIDNAIKHNIVQPSNPLKVIIWDEGDYLVVYNNKQLRKQIETSNAQGLVQLDQLYSYLSDKPVLIEDNHEHYTIKIPLL